MAQLFGNAGAMVPRMYNNGLARLSAVFLVVGERLRTEVEFIRLWRSGIAKLNLAVLKRHYSMQIRQP